jgi:hypothetical protein
MPDYEDGQTVGRSIHELTEDEALRQSLEKQREAAHLTKENLERELAIINRVIAGCNGGLLALDERAEQELKNAAVPRL